MNRKKSIRKEFIKQLLFMSTLLMFLLSFIFYGFLKSSIYEDFQIDLVDSAKLIKRLDSNININKTLLSSLEDESISVDIIKANPDNPIMFYIHEKGNRSYVELLYPYDIKNSKFIQIVKDTTEVNRLFNKIFGSLLFINVAGFVLVILYAFILSKTLLIPINQMTTKLSTMNEEFLDELNINKFPVEFQPLTISINNLIRRIDTFVKYQKELFIGVAHELKTPLTVMKLKNEVTLIKKRDTQKYIDTLKININNIDEMNKMISLILDIGRQEGAQLENPIDLDIIDFLKNKIDDYELLAKEKNITLISKVEEDNFITTIQPTLLTQIVQNFIQNAIKFTESDRRVFINIYLEKLLLNIEVVDEGCGIDESIDLFAPFKRVGERSGAGLGLFLAKGAADAMGAEISIKNREDGEVGTVAKLVLSVAPTCKI